MRDSASIVEEPAWVAPIYDYVGARLQEHPASFPPSVERQEALMVLDGPLHLHEAPRFASTLVFLRDRMQRTIEEIEHWEVREGARIWRLYNMGFVVRTPSASLGMDLVGGWRLESDEGLEYYGICEEWIARLAGQLDVLTISHCHQDHMDPLLRDLLFERGIPVLVPPGVYEELVDQPLLHRPDRGHELTALHRHNDLSAGKAREIEYIAYPGHQGAEIPNNMYLFQTRQGATILHTGDQSGDLDWEWIDAIGDYHRVDVLIANCWTTDMARLVRGVRPGLVVTGHETEMSHGPDHREAYWRSFELFRGKLDPPSLVLCWGEGASYTEGNGYHGEHHQH